MRRQFQSVSPETSIDPIAHSGRGTKQETRSDNGLANDRKGIISVRRGDKIDLAPKSETREDLISPSFAVVEARSGNDSSQMDEADENSDLAFDQLNEDLSGDPVVSAPSTKMWLGLAAAVGMVFWFSRR
jgi:hypothetical protein